MTRDAISEYVAAKYAAIEAGLPMSEWPVAPIPRSTRDLLIRGIRVHANEEPTCPTLDAPADYHFDGNCEDCDVARFARMTPDRIAHWYQTGRASQDDYEAYMHTWALLSPSGSGGAWRVTPEGVNVRRLVRKLLRARGAEVPTGLVEAAPAPVPCPASCCGDDDWRTA
ncbi:hypothetical protein ABTX80_25020 [Streptomyces erythrochromogenes]|uniref:hypothetical protein n=1 Tax=Streptomyces erythrochromogenes TaxID=285574 RepID=UPI00332B3C80